MKIIKAIGAYLIADGLISYFHFKDTANPSEQFFRIARSGIGSYLLLKK